MAKTSYMDHITHHVNHYRKKERDQREQDTEVVRELNQLQLLDSKRRMGEKKQAVVGPTDDSSQETTPLNAVVRPNPNPRPQHYNNTNNKGNWVRRNRAGDCRCYRCGSEDHWRSQCQQPRKDERCHICQGKGSWTPPPQDGANALQMHLPEIRCPACDGSGRKGVPCRNQQVGGNPGPAPSPF